MNINPYYLAELLGQLAFYLVCILAFWTVYKRKQKKQIEKDRELLKQFFGGYFHQDWECNAENPTEVVSEYRNRVTEKERLTLRRAILDYESRFKNDPELEEKLYSEFGCSYKPTADGITVRGWLQSVAAQLLGNRNYT